MNPPNQPTEEIRAKLGLGVPGGAPGALSVTQWPGSAEPQLGENHTTS